MKIQKRCNKAGCRELIDYDKKYCEKHEGYGHKEYNRIRRQNDKEYVSFYNSAAWKKVRYQALLRDGFECQRCLKDGRITEATIGDHIIPTKERWDLRLDIDNVQAMCFECHNIKTSEDEVKYS